MNAEDFEGIDFEEFLDLTRAGTPINLEIFPPAPQDHDYCQDVLDRWSNEAESPVIDLTESIEEAGPSDIPDETTPPSTTEPQAAPPAPPAPPTVTSNCPTALPASLPPNKDQIFADIVALGGCDCHLASLPNLPQLSGLFLLHCQHCGVAHAPDLPCGFSDNGQNIFPDGQLVDSWYQERRLWNLKNGHGEGCGLLHHKGAVNLDPAHIQRQINNANTNDQHATISTDTAAGQAVSEQALLPEQGVPSATQHDSTSPQDTHRPTASTLQLCRTSSENNKVTDHRVEDSKGFKKRQNPTTRSTEHAKDENASGMRREEARHSAHHSSETHRVSNQEESAITESAENGGVNPAIPDDHGDEDLKPGSSTRRPQVSKPAKGPLKRQREDTEEEEDRGEKEEPLRPQRPPAESFAETEPREGFCCRAICGKGDDNDMIQCENDEVHATTHWWHIGCVPYQNWDETPQGTAPWYCVPCIDAGYWPPNLEKPGILAPGQKPRTDRKYSLAEIADQKLFPNPLLGSDFYGSQIKGGNGWEEWEQRACIFQMKRLEPRWRGARHALLVAVSKEMLRVQRADKGWGAVKSWWQRNGRVRGWYDERNRPRAGFEGITGTSLQGQDRLDAVETQRRADSQGSSNSTPRRPQPTRRQRVKHHNDNDDDDDDDDYDEDDDEDTPKVKTTGLGKGKGVYKRSNRAPPARKQPRKSILTQGTKIDDPIVLDDATLRTARVGSSQVGKRKRDEADIHQAHSDDEAEEDADLVAPMAKRKDSGRGRNSYEERQIREVMARSIKEQ